MPARHPMSLLHTMAMILLIAALTGCAGLNQTDRSEPRAIMADRLIADLTPHIESLYLAWHELDQTYKDIKYLERGFLFDADDRQLGTIQKAALYVQDASARIHHQWEQLSVLAYIRPEMLRDYLTLRADGLTSAIKEIGYDEQFLTIYGSFIAHDTVTQDLTRAQLLIKKNVDVLNQILARLLPLVNATSPPTEL